MFRSRDSETAISSHTKRLKYPSVWLDALPLDICTRIASFLPPYRTNHENRMQHLPDSLSLAAVSLIQQIAIASSQSNILSIEQVNNIPHTIALIRLWREVLDNIHEVTLPIDTIDNEDVRNLLSLPTIHRAVIPNYPCLLRALHTGQSVKFLELKLTVYCPENGEMGLATDVSELLRSCPIEGLRLVCLGCNYCPRYSCFAARVLQPLKRGQKCATLRSLHLKCTSEQMEPLTRVVPFFPNLEDFRVEHWVAVDHFLLDRPVQLKMSHEIYENLRRVKRLAMINCGSVDKFIPQLGPNLSGLSSVVRVSSAEIMTFASCPNLRSLDIVLKEGAEICFPMNLCNLNSISLTWNPKHRPSLHEHYYAPVAESLSGFIRRNKQMEELRLKNVMMTPLTLSELLSTTSSKLRVLYVPIFHQGESAARRFSRLARLIIRYNESLEGLEICSASFGNVAKQPVLRDHESGTCDPNKCAFCDLQTRIEGVLRVLKRRLVRFCDDGVKRLQFNLEPWR